MNALTFLQNLKEQFLHFLSCMGFKLVSQLVKLGKMGETYTLVMKILCGQGDMQSLSLISDLASITNPLFPRKASYENMNNERDPFSHS